MVTKFKDNVKTVTMIVVYVNTTVMKTYLHVMFFVLNVNIQVILITTTNVLMSVQPLIIIQKPQLEHVKNVLNHVQLVTMTTSVLNVFKDI